MVPSTRPRYAITTWYYSETERNAAVSEGADAEQDIETKRIMDEISRFEQQTGKGFQLVCTNVFEVSF